MPTNETRYFDQSLYIPEGLSGVRIKESDDAVYYAFPEENPDIDEQTDTMYDEDSELDEDAAEDELEVPGHFEVVSQTTRTAPDGSQVVDVVIDVEEVDGASKYEIRLGKP